jgi:hypothetical protein
LVITNREGRVSQRADSVKLVSWEGSEQKNGQETIRTEFGEHKSHIGPYLYDPMRGNLKLNLNIIETLVISSSKKRKGTFSIVDYGIQR